MIRLASVRPAPAEAGSVRFTRRSRAGSMAAVLSRRRLQASLRVLDAGTVAVVGYATWVLRAGTFELPVASASAILDAALLTAGIFHLFRLYDLPPTSLIRVHTSGPALLRLLGAGGTVLLALLAVAFATKSSGELSRIWMVSWWGLLLVLLPGLRAAVGLFAGRTAAGRALRMRVAVLGHPAQSRDFVDYATAWRADEFDVVGRYAAGDPADPGWGAARPDGGVEELIARCRRDRIDRIVVAAPWDDVAGIEVLCRRLAHVAVDVDLAPGRIAYQLGPARHAPLDGLPAASLLSRPLGLGARLTKAALDRALAAVLLVALSPLLLAVAVAVKLSSPGPVLFRQQRYGYNNTVITVFKFRTMRQEAGQDQLVPQATRGDPRITALGAWLRRYSIDELPQLLNVLGGSMSLVGPRPHAVPHNQYYATLIDDYYARHTVKPGITGWAQVNGFRGETADPRLMEKRVEHDLYYIRHWSLLLDLRILVRTAAFGFTDRRAY
jgi:Undecaprenyl-phosphate glucose phosphotransferase